MSTLSFASHAIKTVASYAAIPEIPNLLQWYAADQETGRTDGDDIASIVDRSGRGNTLTGATGPDWRNAANGINGVPAYSFSGGRECSASGRVVPLTNFTLIWVMSAWTGGRPIGLENDGSGSNGLGLYTGGWIVRNGGGSYDIGVAYTSSPVVAAFRAGPGGIEAHTFGQAASGGGSRTDTTGYSDAGVNFTLGSSGNGGSDMTGKIAEFVSYSRRLGELEFYGLVGFLRAKYGI